MRGRDARKLLVPHFGLPIMVALESSIDSLRVWMRPEGTIIAVTRPTAEVREILISHSWKPRKWKSACVWWDERWSQIRGTHWQMAPLAQRPNSFISDGQMFHASDTGEAYIFIGPRGKWVLLRPTLAQATIP